MSHGAQRESKHPADHIPDKWDDKLKPIVDLLLGSEGPKLGSAAEVGRRSVRYFRAKDTLVWLWKNWEDVEEAYEGDAIELLKLNDGVTCNKLDQYPEDFDAENLRPNDVMPLVEMIIRKKFIYRADRHEVKVAPRDEDDSDDSVDEEVKRLEEKDKRWPKKLIPYPVHSAEGLRLDLSSVYVCAYEREADKKWSQTVLIMLVMCAFIVVGYPAWPYWAKEKAAYLSVFLASVLIFISILRLITFVLMWYIGYDFWIMPNLWADDLGLIDIFRPLYSFAPRNDGKVMYIVRAFAFVMMCLSMVKLNETHSLTDMGEFVGVQYLDFVDWGVTKMTGQGEELARVDNTGFGGINASLSELLKEEEEFEEEVEEEDSESEEEAEVEQEL